MASSDCLWFSPHVPFLLFPQSSLMDLADVFTAPAPPQASDPWGAPAPVATGVPPAASASDPWGGPGVPPAADPWGGPASTPASGDPWRPAAPTGPSVDPWGGTPAPAAGEGPTPDPWGSSDGEHHHLLFCIPLGQLPLQDGCPGHRRAMRWLGQRAGVGICLCDVE